MAVEPTAVKGDRDWLMDRALVIDPDFSEQNRLLDIINGYWPTAEASAATSLADGYGQIGRCMPGLLITDFYLPDGSGLELIEYARRLYPESLRVIVTRHDDSAHIVAALKRGIDGYILKDQADDGIGTLLGALRNGQPALSPEITRQIMRQFETGSERMISEEVAALQQARAAGLTQREIEVLALLSQGADRHQVGKTLNIRPSTVAGHIKSIYLKLNVSTRAEATLAAVKLGLVPLGS